MTVPVATYRLQFRDGVTFEVAAGLAPYLQKLGVSHLYGSPIFAARPESEHGYDVSDCTKLEPALGGEAGFKRLSRALTSAGLEMIVDFVPNHMGTSENNPWWQSVLEWGEASDYARFFDIDWSRGRLILPVLPIPYGEALEAGQLGVSFDARTGRILFTHGNSRLPLTPPSYALVLEAGGNTMLGELGALFRAAGPAGAPPLQRRLARLAETPATGAALQAAASTISAERDRLHAVHEAQTWRLADWRLGREHLVYRRFFEITDLICLRVEDRAVFDAVHALLGRLLSARDVSGVRVDHVDGLADPREYLARLQTIFPAGAAYVLVEKILGPDESLRSEWPVAGTTGYEFIASLAGVLVWPGGEKAMTAAYRDFSGEKKDYAEVVSETKREVFSYNLAAELETLTAMAQEIALEDASARDLGADTLRRAIVALAAALPVYRTYVDAGGAMRADRALMDSAARNVRERHETGNGRAVEFIKNLVCRDVRSDMDPGRVAAFSIRFQQTTGAVMAKSVEDTAFYRFNRLIALNEVGGAPGHFGAPLAHFHDTMAKRSREQPAGLSATSTHDTKRGEDARARLYVLSEMPEDWACAVARWSDQNSPHARDLACGRAPTRNDEWLFYQSLLGAWPAPLVEGSSWRHDPHKLAELCRRMVRYMKKATREAKQRTDWLAPDLAYEAAVCNFVERALSLEASAGFLEDFIATARPIWRAGALNGLSQLAVKLIAPGVPDFYQGAEFWDVSLVDPDNRGQVDFDRRAGYLARLSQAAPEALVSGWVDGRPKMALTGAGLALRRRHPALFAEGAYVPLEVTGTRAGHVIAFARRRGSALAIVVAPRLAFSMLRGTDRPLVPARAWEGTVVSLPRLARPLVLEDVVTGQIHEADDVLDVGHLLTRFPVSVLEGVAPGPREGSQAG